MKRLLKELGTFQKFNGTMVTRITHGNFIAVIVNNKDFENSNYYKPFKKCTK